MQHHTELAQLPTAKGQSPGDIDFSMTRLRSERMTLQGDMVARVVVMAALPQLEANGWSIVDVTRRIWTGEREWARWSRS
jgi:hypothetical protein